MYKKWKSVAALGMAVLIGCMMPVDTMIVAAEENQEAGQEIETDSDSDDDAVDDDGAILDGENTGDEENVDDGIIDDDNVGDETDAGEGENTSDEVNADEDENADDETSGDENENADFETDIDNYGIALMSEAEVLEAGETKAQESSTAPVITIMFQGQNYTRDLGGKVDFKYINDVSQAFECSASQGASLSYCLEPVWPNDAAKDEESMPPMKWQEKQPSFSGYNAHYVLYVKAEANGQTVYARSGGIVVDTQIPVVTGVEDGKSYPEGTPFKVEDNIDLESVTLNGIPVTLAPDGSYQGSVSGTSYVIWAKDKAGNEMTCSIGVSKDPANNIISENGIYSLKADTPYQLAAGEWQVGGDKSVYSGNSKFYVKDKRDYTFTKR